ncbi:hypothetical protein ACQFN5_00210 (plasmid) [Klebsiella sp. WOUb02]|uniref:hypothetical protein n=1 Tax=Klebsiella sp. WOUb02 TaxID=3161071 RepID=UPI003CF019F4
MADKGAGGAGRPTVMMTKRMTVKAFKERLAGYADDTLCCGTFWLAGDFLALDETLDEDTLDAAMERAQDAHDANEGFSRQHPARVTDEVKQEDK